MKQMVRYLIGAVIGGTLAALLVILSLELVFTFIDETGDTGRGDYTLGTAALYVLLTAPYRIYRILPMATLIGSLMSLGALAARNELTAMRAAGFSPFATVRAVVVGGLVLAAGAVALGEWVIPPSERWAQEMRSTALGESPLTARGAGFWVRDRGRFVQVERALTDRRLQGIQIYRLDEQRRVEQITRAAEALYTPEGWVLQEAAVTHFAEAGVQLESFERLPWVSDLEPRVLEAVVVEPDSLPLQELYTYINYLQRSGQESAAYELAFWVKIATPLATIAMLLLTVPMVFGQVRSAGAGQRIFLGVLIGLVFFLGNRLLNHAGLVYGLPPSLSALLPTLLVLAAGTIGLLRFR
jgi:lipopolysaccharide export system permease protein